MRIMPNTINSYIIPFKEQTNYNTKPSFQGAKDINFAYILEKHAEKLPKRIIKKVEYYVEKVSQKEHLTLRELHLKTYSKLLECKTLEDAKRKFPEFKDVLDISILNNSRQKFIKKMEVEPENLSLRLLQEYYGRLKNQKEIVEELNLSGKQALQTINEKINLPVFPKNYRAIINASDEVFNGRIAAKMRAYNQLHPDLIRAHNKLAAQSNKSIKYRLEQSERMKEYDKNNPERRKKIGKFTKEVWSRVPNIRKALSDEMNNVPNYKMIAVKKKKRIPLNEQEQRMEKVFFKSFWEKHPDLKVQFANTCREVSAERKLAAEIASE